MTDLEILKVLESLEGFKYKNVYTYEQIEKDRNTLNKLKEQLRLGGVVVPEGTLCECDDEDDTIPMRWICTKCDKEWKP